MINKDAYIGLVRYDSKFNSNNTIINSISVNVSESVDDYGRERTNSSAIFNIINLNTSNELSIINVYISSYSKETDLSKKSISIPSRYSLLQSFSFQGLNGPYNTKNFVVNNIPAHPVGYFHKFKLEFIDSNKELASVYYDNDAYIGSLDSGMIFTATDEQAWNPNELSGMECLIIQNGVYTTVNPMRIVSNTSQTIQLSLTDDAGTTIFGDECEILFYPSNQLYLFNSDGYGYEFNGISDEYEEIPSVTNLKYYSINLDEYSDLDNAGDWNDMGYIDLEFDNMWNHNDINDHMHADGTIKNVTKKQFLKNKSYIIFMQIKDFTYSGTQSTYPDNSTEWFIVDVVPDIHAESSSKPKYRVRIGAIPVNKQIGFWVGCSTATMPKTSSTKDIKTVRGEIKFKDIV